jgi:DNA repair protein RecN (Recombination protein N)
VDLHGQHEHQTLLRSDEQRAVLDGFAGALELAGEVARRHGQVSSLEGLLEEGEARRRELEARADFVRFQWEEIQGAEVDPEADSRLPDELVRLEHGEELLAGARDLAELLYSGEEAISDALSAARDRFRQISRLDPTLEAEGVLLEQAYHEVVEVGRRLERYASGVELDPARLEEVRARLDLLHRLRRKYGPGLEEVEGTRLALRAELDELENAGEDRSALVASLEEERRALEEAAGRLREMRLDGGSPSGPRSGGGPPRPGHAGFGLPGGGGTAPADRGGRGGSGGVRRLPEYRVRAPPPFPDRVGGGVVPGDAGRHLHPGRRGPGAHAHL